MFDSLGLVYTLKISDVRGVDLSSIGLPINSFVRAFTSNTKIVNSFVMKDDGSLSYDYFKDPDESYFIFSTKMGLIKKTAYKEYTDLKQSVVAINLNTGDEVVSVQYANKDRNVLVYTYAGYGSLFNTDSITETKRMSKGVRSLELIPNDGVKNTAIIGNNDSHVVLFTERGYCKRMGLDLVPKQERRSDGYTLINLDDGDLLTYVDSTSDNNTFRVYMTEEHFDVNSQSIPDMYRLNKGKKIVPVKRGDHIIRIDKF
jgi:DNA gyrase subunit A